MPKPRLTLTDEDFSDMHHALGYPVRANSSTYRNYYCCQADSITAKRFEATNCWDFSHHINGGKDAIYSVNGLGKEKLAEWINKQQAASAAAE